MAARGRVTIPLVVAFTLAGCAAPTPRRDVTTGAAVVVPASPRAIAPLGPVDAPTTLRLTGVLDGRDPTDVVVDRDVRVVEVLVELGEIVEAGDPVLTVLDRPERADELEREILVLAVELANERGDAEAAATAAADLLAFDVARRAGAETLVAPVAGAVTDVRPGIETDVAAGATAFTVIAPDDLAVVLGVNDELRGGLAPGTAVSADLGGTLGAALAPGRVDSVRPLDADRFDVRVVLDTPPELPLGTTIDVVVPLAPGPSGALWVDRDLLHRRDGTTFLLVEDDDGSLRRQVPSIRRATDRLVELTARPGDPALTTSTRVVRP